MRWGGGLVDFEGEVGDGLVDFEGEVGGGLVDFEGEGEEDGSERGGRGV